MIESAVAAVRAGEPIVLPTDTVYGLAADASREEPVHRMYRLKGRAPTQPTALLAANVDVLLDLLPELRGPAEDTARALLPGPYTLVVSNPARRFPWLSGERPETLGVRVPNLRGDAAEVLHRVGALAATSANLPGGQDPRRLGDVPEVIRAGCAAALDGGELPGTPSTVVDLTGTEPRILREGAVPASEALSRIAALRAGVRG